MGSVPKAHSLRVQLLAYLDTHPDARLTPAQIALRFERKAQAVKNVMHQMVQAGEVAVVARRRHNSPVYAKGDGVPVPVKLTARWKHDDKGTALAAAWQWKEAA